MGRFEDMTVERPVYLTNKQGKEQRSAAGQNNFEWVLGIFGDMPTADFARIILRTLDGLPFLPQDPSLYPATGGLFKNGDVGPNGGYTLTRLYGNTPRTGNAVVDAMLNVFDAAPAYPTDPVAIMGVAPGIYRDGDENGYRIVRAT